MCAVESELTRFCHDNVTRTRQEWDEVGGNSASTSARELSHHWPLVLPSGVVPGVRMIAASGLAHGQPRGQRRRGCGFVLDSGSCFFLAYAV